ncbi:MAG TPA: SMI1/KNR4 family protein [Blastocatellia bacterium]|nr:SMI1/KNR4 family protein [Blastocatellia bacterium]
MIRPVDKLKTYWLSTGVRVRPPASFEEIASFEARYSVLLPQDMREYFSTFDGMQEDEFDQEMLSFWPLNKIETVPAILTEHSGIPDYRAIAHHLPEASSYFIFADYLIFSHVYAIHLSSAGDEENQIIWIGDGNSHCMVADSFSDFLEKYLADPSNANNPILFPA